ncbi:MAG: hypothetical protein HFG18_09625 [Oscillospiraceae bacterium]|nr:hypothetical protein [Oscillospiraceae bacterium]MCI9526860.1 hypothetical protein [Lachnospiraceae bacterium]
MAKTLFEKFYPYYSDRYDIRFCRTGERDQLVEFIESYWKHNHALVLSPDLLTWQHLDQKRGIYTFSVAQYRDTGKFHAIQGFILSSQFDSSICNPIRWGAIWKNQEDISEPGLGILVEQHMAKYAPAAVGVGIGLSPGSRGIGKKHGNVLGKVARYYILNPHMSQFKLAKNTVDIKAPHTPYDPDKYIVELSETEYLSLPDAAFEKVPFFKSKWYYVNRYYRHPIYRYHASAVRRGEEPIAVLFWRICNYQNACCLRIVDYIGTGEEMYGCQEEFLRMVEEHHAEFLDFMNVGIAPECFANAGFLNRRDSDIVLAHYFEPFLLENDDLDYEWDNPSIPVLIFKGDADMDRPNIIEVR